MQPVRSQVTCHVISWAWRGIAWRRRCQLTVPPGCARLYGTVHDCIDRTGYDVRLAVSCRCVCPAWQDREPLHLQTPHFIIDTQRTPRAPALENFITQGPAMTSLWNAHPPGHMPTSCNTHYFLHARIERTDHRQRHSGSGLDVRMSQCNAMQCTAGPARWWKQTVSVEGTTRRKCAETTNRNCGVTAVWSSCLHCTGISIISRHGGPRCRPLGSGRTNHASTDPPHALMPDPDRVGCLPSEARNSKLCDVLVADICLSHSLSLFLRVQALDTSRSRESRPAMRT